MEGRRRVDKITAEGYLDGIEDRPLDELREMRTASSEEEALLSYERRLLHGRLAIFRGELERRAGGGSGSLVDSLPRILADERGSSRGAFPGSDPRLDFQHPQRRVSKLVSDDILASVGTLEDSRIEGLVAELEEAEREVSGVRRRVLDVVDALNKELARRYASGEADPSDILSREG